MRPTASKALCDTGSGYLSVGGSFVMAGHSRSKNGVASLAYVPAIHVFATP
jgi:hypothetical protein